MCHSSKGVRSQLLVVLQEVYVDLYKEIMKRVCRMRLEKKDKQTVSNLISKMKKTLFVEMGVIDK